MNLVDSFKPRTPALVERFAIVRGAPKTLAFGNPRFTDATLAAEAARLGTAAAWQLAFQRFGRAAPAHVEGDFAVALRDGAGDVFLAVDRFAIRSLCYRCDGDDLMVAERADDVAGSAAIDPQAIYDYLYFHVIPAPRTIFAGVSRLSAGTQVTFDKNGIEESRWWMPKFVEDESRPFPQLRDEFRTVLRDSVARSLVPGITGCFLSGGTDSSTVAGMLRDVTGEAPHTFSIGFDADGYDEMAFARIAARHFGTRHHEYYLTADDIVASVPKIAVFYDQPFGNSSVVPAYRCAMLARDCGVEQILAGDGGDELFGGNVRYAKQTLFELYSKVPGALRRGIVERVFNERTQLANVRPFSKVVSYITQAKTPLPDRMQMYNLLTRLGPQQLFRPEFLGRVDVHGPAVQQRRVFAAVAAKSLVNRMLGYDWKYTLADTDLPKVMGATSLAGIETGFPFLDDRVVDFSLRLEPSYKLKGLKLRWFFKEALRGYLPDEILAKQKHGFGLPYGAWLVRGGPLLDMTVSSLESLAGRGIVSQEFLKLLIRDLLPSAPGYYGELVWILMMLEQWWSSHEGRRVNSGDRFGFTSATPTSL